MAMKGTIAQKLELLDEIIEKLGRIMDDLDRTDKKIASLNNRVWAIEKELGLDKEEEDNDPDEIEREDYPKKGRATRYIIICEPKRQIGRGDRRRPDLKNLYLKVAGNDEDEEEEEIDYLFDDDQEEATIFNSFEAADILLERIADIPPVYRKPRITEYYD